MPKSPISTSSSPPRQIDELREEFNDLRDDCETAARIFGAVCALLVDYYGTPPLHLRLELEDLGRTLGAALPLLHGILEFVR